MTQLKRTVFFDRHVAMGAQMMEFGGWEMPVQYRGGIIKEHLATRGKAGLFDVSHMGRFIIRGGQALAFLQQVLTSNAASLDVGQSQYTLIPDNNGGAIDDAYLYRFEEEQYLLVVNAANRQGDWDHFQQILKRYEAVQLQDVTESLAMISLQGPLAKEILSTVVDPQQLPEPVRNYLSVARLPDGPLWIGRTGYTGEPLCFELFIECSKAAWLWDALVYAGAQPIGLGARDTLRLEAGLPLYGHELGRDPEGGQIPLLASPISRFAVSFSPLKGEFVGRSALRAQFLALGQILNRIYGRMADLPRRIMCLALTDKGVARSASRVYRGDVPVGWVTSGTVVPYWHFQGEGLEARISNETGRRAIALALLDSDLCEGDVVQVDIRGKHAGALIVPYHLRSEAPPYARPITCHQPGRTVISVPAPHPTVAKIQHLVQRSLANNRWRQRACINLIPSEQTASRLTRLLTITDPAGRYAEHKAVKAFCEAEVFYYQGTDFIAEIETLLNEELCRYLNCSLVESRVVSGQMANTSVFSALVDFCNRADRKREPRRIRSVMNHHIIKGGHLSAQPMGALRDFVARHPRLEKPAAINFPVLPENPYMIDVEACRELLAEYRPELIILGKSMILYKEPVAQMRALIEELELDCLIMYDMAHVLGLVGPHFQEPFAEGADLVTGSTHKTYFGTQRGLIGANWREEDLHFELWETIQRRSFPGSVSNHHLGTLLGLLMAAYEMDAFRDAYQPAVLANAKAFARALDEVGLDVAGDRSLSFTETHQVLLNVGYGQGPEIARRLERNNIILNFQAGPYEEGFTAAGCLRMGVAEMTRFGMQPEDFAELAELMHAVIVRDRPVKAEIARLRERFWEMQYCFSGPEIEELAGQLMASL